MKTELWTKQNAEYLQEQKGGKVLREEVMSLSLSMSLPPSTLNEKKISVSVLGCFTTEKEERIQREKDEGTYKEKVLQNKSTLLPITT